MAVVSSLNPFLTKSYSFSRPNFQLTLKNSLSPFNSVTIPSNKVVQFPKFSILESNRSKLGFRIRAFENEESSEPEQEETVDGGIATAVIEEPKVEIKEITNLKKALIDSLYGTDRGLRASSETRAEISELITQFEAKNPNPAPTEALTLLDGKWILAYTSFTGLFPLLARGTLPLVNVEEISQIIDSENFTVQNSVQFAGLIATTSFSTNAKFEVRSPKRVQIKFEEGIIGTPQLTDSIVLPENVEFLGQKIDFTPFKGLLTSIQDAASSVIKTISSQQPLKINITNAESWLLTTYLDEGLRISRGDGGSVFVLIKEGSSLLTP